MLPDQAIQHVNKVALTAAFDPIGCEKFGKWHRTPLCGSLHDLWVKHAPNYVDEFGSTPTILFKFWLQFVNEENENVLGRNHEV